MRFDNLEWTPGVDPHHWGRLRLLVIGPYGMKHEAWQQGQVRQWQEQLGQQGQGGRRQYPEVALLGSVRDVMTLRA